MVTGSEASASTRHSDRIQVVSRSGMLKERKGFVSSIEPINNNIFFYNNSLSVVQRALNERLYFVKSPNGLVPCPRPSPGAFEQLSESRRAFLRSMPYHPPVWTTEQFVQSYTGAKRKRYEAAALRLEKAGPKRSMGYWNTFIKGEWYDGTSKSDPCPRLIQPRSYEYNILIGRYIRPVEKALYEAINRAFGYEVVMKCHAPWTRAKHIVGHWNEFNKPCFVGFDASRFDQHVSDQALRFEHSIYNAIFRDKDLAQYLTWQIDNIGFANMCDGTVKYTSTGCRGSGDMNTSCGNVVIMCAIVHAYLSKLGVKTRFINDGDDGGVIIEAKHLHLLDHFGEHCLNFGFEMEIETPVYKLEEVEFCQSRPVRVQNDIWMMVRNVHKCIKLDRCSIVSRDWASYDEVQHATGLCGLALYEGFPVLDSWYRSMLSDNVRSKVVKRLIHEMQTGPRTWRSYATQARGFSVDLQTARISMYHAFGLLPDDQLAYENKFRAIKFDSHKLTTHTHSSDTIQYYLD